MLTVAIVANFPESPTNVRGGVEAATFNLVRGLVQFPDLRVHVIGMGGQAAATERWTDPPVTVCRVQRSWPGFLTYWNLTRWSLARSLRALAPDVVHVEGAAAWLGPRVPWPRVLTVHGIGEKDLLLSGLPLARVRSWVTAAAERRARPRYPHVILISPYVLEEIGDQIRGRTYHIDNAVEESCFHIPRAEVQNRILYVGSLIPRKNIHGLIESAGRLAAAHTDFEFRFVGGASSQEYFARVQSDAARCGVADRVRFLGWQGREGIRRELAEAACLVLASFQETAPVVIEEAMAAGIPVVATRVGGVAQMVTDGQTGFLVEPGDMAGFADRVRQLLESKPLREEMGRRAAEAARRRFAPDAVAEKTRKVYYEVAGRAAPDEPRP
jgi:glycosyltransferase involved in cell wall biosynthesis